MRELGMVAVVMSLLGTIAAALAVSWDVAFGASIWVVAAGFALGVPTGFVYHVQLYRRLRPRDELPRGWIWNPLALHEHLRDDERFGVLSWAYVGGLGFWIICLGLVGLVAAIAGVFINGI